jgi:hypothetical protein
MMTGGPWKRVRIAHKIVGKMRRVKMACWRKVEEMNRLENVEKGGERFICFQNGDGGWISC